MDLLNVDFSLFHFLRPYWFWALLPLALILLALRIANKRSSGWQSVLANHLYQHLISSQTATKAKPNWLLLSLGWLIVVFALAGPTWERLPQPVYQLNTGKVVLIDMSLSMRATDIKPDRLTRAKYKAIDLVKKIAEGETGLIAYAGDAFTISPLSTDGQNLTTLLPSLTPEIMPLKGSEPLLGLQAAAELLSNAGFNKGEIFWITDGVETQQMKALRDFLVDIPYRLSVLAVGTDEGAPIKQVNGDLLKDHRGAVVLPKLNSGQLQELANIGDGRFAQLQADDSDIDYLTSQELIDRETEESEDDSQSGDQWREMGPLLVLLLLPIAAYGFRRGVIPVVAVMMLIPLYSPTAEAGIWEDMWQRKDQQGQQAFDQQEYARAAEHFDDPMWRGSAQFKNEDYQAAADTFSRIDSAEGAYNLGNALAKLGELDAAIDAYNKALAKDPDHTDAKANRDLLEKLKQQQEQQQEQDQQQQNQDQQQQDQQQQDQQQNGSGENSDQSQQEQQQSQDENAEQQDPQQSEEQQQEAEEQQAEEEQSAEQQQAEAQQQELTDEQKEQALKMQNLLRKIPDDPAFLLKRKMQLEHQQRKRQDRYPPNQSDW